MLLAYKTASPFYSDQCQSEMHCLQAFKLLQNHLGSLNILDGLLKHKNFIALSSHSFPRVSASFIICSLLTIISFFFL
jgi:hypothetical protein